MKPNTSACVATTIIPWIGYSGELRDHAIHAYAPKIPDSKISPLHLFSKIFWETAVVRNNNFSPVSPSSIDTRSALYQFILPELGFLPSPTHTIFSATQHRRSGTVTTTAATATYSNW